MASSAFEQAANAIKTYFDLEFAAESFVLQFDNLHESLGRYSVEVGIAPVEDTPKQGSMLELDTKVEIRFYDLWTDEIDPTTAVDPRRITGFAERFRECVRLASRSTPGSQELWFFDIERLWYPNDPTGNKSRFHALVRCVGNNNNLIETV